MVHFLRAAGAVIAIFFAFQSVADEVDPSDPRYTWDLTSIYPSVEAWNAARDEVLEQFEAIEARRGKLGDSADDLYRTLRLVSDTSRQAARVSTFASLNADEDLRNSETQEWRQLSQVMYSRFSVAINLTLIPFGQASWHS